MDHLTGGNVLVTGGTGFIGLRLVERLRELGCNVTCMARTKAKVDALRSMGAQVVPGDVTDQESIARALEASGASTVFHLAGLVKAADREDFMKVNARGTQAVAQACATSTKKPVLVVVSSLAAAGPGLDKSETDLARPVSAYGKSKLAGEQAALACAGTVPVTIVRPPIVYGPGDRGVLQMFKPISQIKMHFVPGYKESRYAMVYVDDLAEGLLLAAQKGERATGAPGVGMYYFAGEEKPTYAELGNLMADALGVRRPSVVRMPPWWLNLCGAFGDVVGRITGDAPWVNSDKMIEATAGDWVCSPAKARGALGWKPAQNIQTRLEQTAMWYRENRFL
jgi:dihydroflavonol-4-reductase